MKHYAIGLITGVLIAISAMMFMGAQNKNLGDITADSIKLVSELGETRIVGGGIMILNAQGKEGVVLGTGDEGGGVLKTLNAHGKQTAYLGTAVGGNGKLTIFNVDGKQTAYLGTGGSGGGILLIDNMNGE